MSNVLKLINYDNLKSVRIDSREEDFTLKEDNTQRLIVKFHFGELESVGRVYKDGPLAASRDNETLSVRLCTYDNRRVNWEKNGEGSWKEEKGRIDSAVIRIAGRNVGYAIEGYPGSEHLGITLEWM